MPPLPSLHAQHLELAATIARAQREVDIAQARLMEAYETLKLARQIHSARRSGLICAPPVRENRQPDDQDSLRVL